MQVHVLTGESEQTTLPQGFVLLGKRGFKIKKPKIVKSVAKAAKSTARFANKTGLTQVAKIAASSAIPGGSVLMNKNVLKLAKNPKSLLSKKGLTSLAKIGINSQIPGGSGMLKKGMKVVKKAKAAANIAKDLVNEEQINTSDVSELLPEQQSAEQIPVPENAALVTESQPEQEQVSIPENAEKIEEQQATEEKIPIPSSTEKIVTPENGTIEYQIQKTLDISGDNINDKDFVKKVQAALVKKGYKVDVDGIYGPGSRSAVIAFQKKNKIDPTGNVGADTMKALGLSSESIFQKVVDAVAKPSNLLYLNPVTAIPKLAYDVTTKTDSGKDVTKTVTDTVKKNFGITPSNGISFGTKAIVGVIVLILILIIGNKVLKKVTR